jgi:hypothetical protein
MDETRFSDGSVPVAIAAGVYGKDPAWVRAGIICGWLPIGKAIRGGRQITKIEDMNSRFGRINYYISPMALYKDTGYIWKGERVWVPKSDRKYQIKNNIGLKNTDITS